MTTGDTCYTDDGRKCVFVAAFDGGAVVRLLYASDGDYSDDEGEPFEGEPCIVERVHEAPPIAVRNETIANLDAEIETKRAKLNEMREEEQRVAAGAKRHKTLAMVLDYLDGKFTHYVYYLESNYGRGGYRIVDASRSNQPGQHDNPLRIPVSRGWGGAFQFTGDNYYDRDVWYCRSLDEAMEKVRALLDADTNAAIEKSNRYALDGIAENYEALNLEAPAHIAEAIASIKREEIEKAAREAEAKAAEARAQLAKVAIGG